MAYKKEELINLLQEFMPFNCKISIKNYTKTIISVRRGVFSTTVILNSIFLEAEKSLIFEIIIFIKNFNKNNSPLKNAKERIKQFYENNQHLLDEKETKTKLNHKFKHKNINLFFNEIVKELETDFSKINFEHIKITWGRKTKNRGRSIRFGSYNRQKKLIRIHPILDNKNIPDHFIRSIIYHEIGHFIYQYLKPDSKSHHNKEFYSLLKKIDCNYFLSEKWEDENKRLFFCPDDALINKFFFSI